MKYRVLLLMLVLASVLFLFAKEPTSVSKPPTAPYRPANLASYIDSIKFEMEEMIKLEHYDSLTLLSPKFNIQIDNAPDSIKLKFRKLCMHYAFQFYKYLNDDRSSLKYYLLAHQFVKDPICLDPLSWYIENEISSIYIRFGDYEKSRYFAELTENSLKCHHQFQFLSRLYTNMGTNQLSFGNDTAAIQLFKKGLHLADSLQYDLGIFSNNLSLADIYNDMRLDSLVIPYLKKAESILPSITNHNYYFDKKSGLAAAYGKYYANQNNFYESSRWYQSAINALFHQFESSKHREFSKLYAKLANVYFKSNRTDSAQYCIDQGLSALLPGYSGKIENLDSTSIYKENSFVDLLVVQYQLLAHQYFIKRDPGYLTKANHCIQLSLYANDLLRHDLTADPSKLSAIRQNKKLTNSGIETLYRLYSIHPSEDYLMKIRDLFTRSKSILYNEKIRRQAIALQLTQEEKNSLDSIEVAMLNLMKKSYESNADFKIINRQLYLLQQKQDAIRALHDDIHLRVLSQENYIEYVQTDSFLFAYSQCRGQIKFLQLGRIDSLQSLLIRMNQYISLKELSLDTSINLDLYRFLVQPLVFAPMNKLSIIPDGQVNLVPFEMLKDEHGEFLLNHMTISYEYQFEPYVLDDDGHGKPDFVFCLAPSYKSPSPVVLSASRGGIYHLPFAKAEVDTIQKIIGTRAVISEDGNKNNCIQELRKAKVFHFSGHAIVKPEVAYLALNDENEMGQQLTDQEIGLMSNPIDMVVLSACETGLGKWEYGEGIRSLGRSFMEAGAGAAVYSLWNVNDRSTARIMSSFYTYLQKGISKDEALRKAKLDFITNSNNGSTHPFHWAAFIAAGDMSPIMKKNYTWLLISGACLVLTLGFWMLLKKKNKSSS